MISHCSLSSRTIYTSPLELQEARVRNEAPERKTLVFVGTHMPYYIPQALFLFRVAK